MSEKQETPQRIWLQWYGSGSPDDFGEVSESDVSWCAEKIYDHDVPYVPESTVEDLLAAAKAALEEFKEYCDSGLIVMDDHDETIAQLESAITKAEKDSDG